MVISAFYQQANLIGEEKNKNKNTQRVCFTRYQTQYNIGHLARVKGNYYYNHRTKNYVHNNLWP